MDSLQHRESSPPTDRATTPTQSTASYEDTSDRQVLVRQPGKRSATEQLDISGEEKKRRLDGQSRRCYMAFHLVTCGSQGNDLGRDETPILQMSVLLMDAETRKVIDTCTLNVRPTSFLKVDKEGDQELCPVSDAAHQLTGIGTDRVDAIDSTLKDALEEINNFLTWHHAHPKYGTELHVVTDGHQPLRSVLHREAQIRQLELEPFWFSYHNVREMAATVANRDTPFYSLWASLDGLKVPRITPEDQTVRAIGEVVARYEEEGHALGEPNVVACTYNPYVYSSADTLEENVVVQIRSVPWSATIATVANFFRGLNLAKGGVAMLLDDGRRNSRAYVCFQDSVQRNLAFKRGQHHLEVGNEKVVEISGVTSEEFLKVVSCDIPAVRDFLAKIVSQDQMLIRIRGLPFTATKEQIIAFFASGRTEVQFGEDGIYFATRPDNRPTGDAFVIFADDSAASEAIKLHKQYIGDRYVELFKSTASEMIQVVHSYQSATRAAATTATMSSKLSDKLATNPGMLQRALLFNYPSGLLPLMASGGLPVLPSLGYGLTTGTGVPAVLPVAPTGQVQAKSADWIIQIRGIPQGVTLEDILSCLPVQISSLIVNHKLIPDESKKNFCHCMISTRTYEDSKRIFDQLHGKRLKASNSAGSVEAQLYADIVKVVRSAETGQSSLVYVTDRNGLGRRPAGISVAATASGLPTPLSFGSSLATAAMNPYLPSHLTMNPVVGFPSLNYPGALMGLSMGNLPINWPASLGTSMVSPYQLPSASSLLPSLNAAMSAYSASAIQQQQNAALGIAMPTSAAAAPAAQAHPAGTAATLGGSNSPTLLLMNVPQNITAEELKAAFGHVLPYLSMEPQFSISQLPNGQCAAYATFRTCQEAQLAYSCCPNPLVIRNYCVQMIAV